MFTWFRKSIDWKIYRLLVGAGFVSFLFILSYLFVVQANELSQIPIPLPLAILLMSLQTFVVLAVITFLGLLLAEKNTIGLTYLREWSRKKIDVTKLKRDVLFSVLFGLLAGLLIVLGDYLFSFFLEPFASFDVVVWKSFLASFYGGIFEEILLRLFFLSLLVWGLSRVIKPIAGKPRPGVVWVGIVLAAIVFGLGHLPATALYTDITPLVITRAILLNSIGGVIYGWLFWRKGLAMGMVAHFVTDLVLLVAIPIFSSFL